MPSRAENGPRAEVRINREVQVPMKKLAFCFSALISLIGCGKQENHGDAVRNSPSTPLTVGGDVNAQGSLEESSRNQEQETRLVVATAEQGEKQGQSLRRSKRYPWPFAPQWNPGPSRTVFIRSKSGMPTVRQVDLTSMAGLIS